MALYKPYSGQAIAGANGAAEKDFTPPSTFNWDVYQIGITSTSVLPSTVSVYLDAKFMCGSNIGNADAADGSPITVRNGSTLKIIWAGCTPGAVCTVNLLVYENVTGSFQPATP